MSKLSFLDADDGAEASTPAETPAESTPEASSETPQAADGQARDEQGRFAPKDKPPEAQPSAEAAPAQPEPAPAAAPEPVTPDPKTEPVLAGQLAALMDEREKRQKYEREAEKHAREAEELRRQLAERARPEAAPPPSIFEDENAFYAHQQAQLQQAMLATRFDFSEEVARSKHGDDTVNAAMEAYKAKAQANPLMVQEIITARNPIEHAVQWHKREQLLAELNADELAQYRAWKAAQAQPAAAAPATAPAQAAPAAPQPAAAPAPAPPTAPTPPRDITAMPSAGGPASPGQVGPGTAFEGLFSR